MTQPKSILGKTRAAAIMKRLDDLEERVHALELSRIFPEPFPTPIVPWVPFAPIDMDPSQCPVCHLRYADMGLYVCGVSTCPHRVTVTSTELLVVETPKPYIGNIPHDISNPPGPTAT